MLVARLTVRPVDGHAGRAPGQPSRPYLSRQSRGRRRPDIPLNDEVFESGAIRMSTLEIRGLRVSVEDKEILQGVDLSVSSGETHAIMGPNGSGKSTLAYSIAGHPKYTVTEGSI